MAHQEAGTSRRSGSGPSPRRSPHTASLRVRPREEGRGFFQELILHPQTGDLGLHLAHPRPLHRTQRQLRPGVLTPPRIDPIAERAVMDPQTPRDLRDRLPRLDHHLHGLGLELRTEPPTLLGHELHPLGSGTPVQDQKYTPPRFWVLRGCSAAANQPDTRRYEAAHLIAGYLHERHAATPRD